MNNNRFDRRSPASAHLAYGESKVVIVRDRARTSPGGCAFRGTRPSP